ALPQHVKGCPLDWSSGSDTTLYVTRRTADSRADGLWSLSVTGPHSPTPLAGTTPTGPRGARGRVSPNGKWVAYEGDGAGRREIFVRAFTAEAGQSWRISQQGGIEPEWRSDGKELF